MNLEKDIDFILSHFDDYNLFPRKMMTAKSNGQFSVFSKGEILKKCEESGFADCRINAYPEYTIWKKYDLIRQPPNFVFIDLDLSNFSIFKNPKRMLDIVLKNTLNDMVTLALERSQRSQRSSSCCNFQQGPCKDIKKVSPTVLWTGNGYHIYLPIQALVLDECEPFSKDRFPNLFSFSDGKYHGYSISEVFLKFAKDYFTNGKADPQHRPKYKSCLIRIPNTFNSKCLAKGLGYEESQVKIIQKWNGYRMPIQLLTKEFRRWIIQEEITQKVENSKIKRLHINRFREQSDVFQIPWIEKLLQMGISDGRKETLRLILGPYLIKKKSKEESIGILINWLNKCNRVRPLESNFNPNQRINSSLDNSKGFLKLESLKAKYPWLYDAIITHVR